jgi:hypothetical protein
MTIFQRSASVTLGCWLALACGGGRTPPPLPAPAPPEHQAISPPSRAVSTPGPIVETEYTLFPEPEDRTWVRLSQLRIYLREFRSRNGRLPDRIEQFRPAPGTEWIEVREDAWGHEIVYRVCEEGYELRSRGIDGRLDTADDLVLTDSSEMPLLGNDAVRWRLDPNAKTCSPSSGGGRGT